MEYPSLDKPNAGATRFNTDSSQLEIYDGNQWTGILATSPEQLTGGTRGVLGGGYNPSTWTNTIDYINISTTGDAVNFGDLTAARGDFSGTISSRTRGCFAGGYFPSPQVRHNTIDYITIASTGNAADFGDLTVARNKGGASTSPTRCVFGGGSGSPTYVDTIDYVEILTTGNAVDFGNLVRGASRCYGSFSNAHGGL